MSREEQEELLKLARNAMNLLELEHIEYYKTDNEWHCQGHCEHGECPALLLRDFLLGQQ